MIFEGPVRPSHVFFFNINVRAERCCSLWTSFLVRVASYTWTLYRADIELFRGLDGAARRGAVGFCLREGRTVQGGYRTAPHEEKTRREKAW